MKRKDDIAKPYVRQIFKGNILNFILAFVGVLMITAAALTVSFIIQQIVDAIGGNGTLSLKQIIFLTLGLMGFLVIAYLFELRFKPKFTVKGISQYKNYIFEEITKKNISAFLGEDSSVYISALTNDIQAIEKGYLQDIFLLVNNILLFVGAFAIMLVYSPLLTAIAVGFSLLPVIATIITGNHLAKAEEEVSNQNIKYTSTLKDALSGFSVIKSFKVEAQMIKLFFEDVKKLGHCQSKKMRISILIELLGNAAGFTAQLGVFIFGAYLALSGKGVTAGTTMLFVQLMNYVVNPIGIIPQCIAEMKSAKGLIRKIATSLNKNVREVKTSNIDEIKDGITINNLSFGYEEDKEILHDINYNFELGKKYAIVGTSGSGKSTLLNLLMASNSNYKGIINYDNEELRNISSDNLYEIESIIQQNVFIFNATIRDNITMFQSFSEEEIDRAIKLSGLSTLINEKGQDYLCGENGSGLSGGEKQRISIARSLLRKSQVLLVDEATAALDKETAFQVSSAILNLEGVTSIVVTHALDEALLKEYDSIITLKNGSIVESGSFESLLNKKGYFYSLFTVSQ